MWTRPYSLTVTVRADFWPGTLVGLSRSLRGLPEDTGVSGPGGHTAATQVEAPLSQTDERIRHYGGKSINNLQRGGLKQKIWAFLGPRLAHYTIGDTTAATNDNNNNSNSNKKSTF